LLSAACLNAAGFAQDNAARAAAEREAAEERYKLLNSAVDALTTGQADLQRRIGALTDEVRSARAQDNKIDTSKFVTREENNLLAIVKAHNEEFKKQGKKTTLQLIRDNNPALKDTNLQVGQKIFVPLVPE